MLNKTFVKRKIKLIQEDLMLLEPFAKRTFSDLEKDRLSYDATERRLERIITRAIDVNRHLIAELGKGSESVRSYEDTFLRLVDLSVYPEAFAKQIAPSAGLRNVLVHEYDEVEERLVFKSVGDALDQYGKYCSYLLKFLEKHDI